MNQSASHWSLRLSVVLILLWIDCLPAMAQGTGVAGKPPLGWNTWYGYLCKVTDSDVRAQADRMVGNGMKAVGFEYVNIDDCWQGQRDAQGVIHGNIHFPDMKALGDYIHRKGLKFGIYSSPGPKRVPVMKAASGTKTRTRRPMPRGEWISSNMTGAAPQMCTSRTKCERRTRKWAMP